MPPAYGAICGYHSLCSLSTKLITLLQSPTCRSYISAVFICRLCIAFPFKSKQMCFISVWCNRLLDLKVLHKQQSITKTDLALLWSYLYCDLCDCDLCWVESGDMTPPWAWKEPVTSTLWINNSVPCFEFTMVDFLSYIRVCHCCLIMWVRAGEEIPVTLLHILQLVEHSWESF